MASIRNPLTGFTSKSASKNRKKSMDESVGKDLLDWCGGMAAGLLAGCLYFREAFWILTTAAVICLLIHEMLKGLRREKHQQNMRQRLKDCLNLLALYLRAGSSISEATKAVGIELLRQSGRNDAFAYRWQQAAQKLELNQSIGRVYEEMAQDLGLEQALWLAGMLNIGTKAGANLVTMVLETEEQLQAHFEFEAQRWAQLATRRLEALIMAAAPFFLTFLLSMSMSDYLQPLYQGKGPWVMLAVLWMQLIGSGCFYVLIMEDHSGNSDLVMAVFMDCLAQLIHAGLTLPAAWRYAAALQQTLRPVRQQPKGRVGKNNEFDRMLCQVGGALAFNGSLTEALSRIAAQSPAAAASRLAGIIVQNIKRGGSDLGNLLKKEAAALRQQRLLSLQRQAGRREIWLIFPLMMMLLSSLLLAAAPALLCL